MHHSPTLLAALWLPLAGLATPASAELQTTALAELDLSGMTCGWLRPSVNAEVGDGAALTVGGEPYDTGIGTHADSVWKLNLAGQGLMFSAKVGVQDGSPGLVEFIVRGDGKDLARSGPMKGGDPAKALKVDRLTGVESLELIVDALGANTSDHANWLEPVLWHSGSPLPPAVPKAPEPALMPDLPGEPPNAAAKVDWHQADGKLSLSYDGKTLFAGRATGRGQVTLTSSSTRRGQAVTQEIILHGAGLMLTGTAAGSSECLSAETRGEAQRKFPLVRTTIGGASFSLRNNALYDRTRDWMLEGPAATRLVPIASDSDGDGHRPPLQAERSFTLTASGDEIRLVFRPRYYQWHKNITHFRPWTYQIRKDSITGWSSWWAYMRNCSQQDCDSLLAVWKDKRFADYGYRFIQLDDCFQNEFGKGQERKGYPGTHPQYVARGPETWLDWRKDIYPKGINGYASACKTAGFEPAVWIGSYITDNEVITKHPDWFIRDAAGKPFVAPWASCGIDATNKQAMDTLVRPTFKGVRKAGFSYVKVDLLRHYLYDNLHHNLDYCKARGVTPDQMYRKYLGTVREELGRDTFLLSCWGVLPESVGLADACRIGGDGYGPMTMQQYNSWNGIVWRNDPDHCDVYPNFKPAQAGNVTQTTAVQATPAETVIRPALASIASCMLILSDRPQVYQNDANLDGLRRSSPVLFSVPGQLYDFTPERTRNLIRMPRTAITSGANPTPIDALQFGTINPWWLNEYNLPCGRWVVLNRINWSANPVAETTVQLADLGIDATKEYVAYEFWSHRYLGVCKGTLGIAGLPANGIASIALREKLDHPQLVSTNRHLSHGGADLVEVRWWDQFGSSKTLALSGSSKVVTADRYELAIRVPAGYTLTSADIAGQPATIVTEGELLRVSFLPTATGTVPWSVRFSRKP